MIPKLDSTDAKLFYDLWIPLLDHVNRTYNVNPKLGKMTRAEGLNIQEVRVVTDFLWSHPAVIDGYLASAELPPDHREILAGWSRVVFGAYFSKTISIWNDGYIKTLGGRFSAALFMISQYESTYSGLLAYILHMNTRFPRVRTVLSKHSFHQPVKNQRLPPRVNHRLVVIPVC